MFYSNNQIKNLITCGLCSSRFADPRIVPCGRTFCNKCIIQSDSEHFECLFKDKTHEIPLDGFVKNLVVESLINQNPHIVSRDENAEELRSKLAQLKSGLEYLRNPEQNSERRINTECSSVRNKIDLNTELAIQNLQSKRDELIKEVNDYEKECLEKLRNSNISNNNIVLEIENFYDTCLGLFEEYNIDNSKINKALANCPNYLDRIHSQKKIIDIEVFDNKIIKFIENKIDFQPIELNIIHKISKKKEQEKKSENIEFQVFIQ